MIQSNFVSAACIRSADDGGQTKPKRSAPFAS